MLEAADKNELPSNSSYYAYPEPVRPGKRSAEDVEPKAKRMRTAVCAATDENASDHNNLGINNSHSVNNPNLFTGYNVPTCSSKLVPPKSEIEESNLFEGIQDSILSDNLSSLVDYNVFEDIYLDLT